MNMDLYYPVPGQNQWWHYVASVKGPAGQEYGVQASRFHFLLPYGNVRRFSHCAITDVAKGRHLRLEDYPPAGRPTEAVIMRTGHSWSSDHFVLFDAEGVEARLIFEPLEKPREYPSETSVHYGHARMRVRGRIGDEPVEGVGCFDREIFQKLLKPGESNWTWSVAWLDDGRTYLNYSVGNSKGKARRRIYEPGKVFFKPIWRQEWPRNGERTFGYEEAWCRVVDADGERVGSGYLETVGLDGKVDL